MVNAPYSFILKRLHETDLAYCVTEDDEEKIWLPKSQVHVDDEIEKEDGTYLLLEIPSWLAEAKGLI